MSRRRAPSLLTASVRMCCAECAGIDVPLDALLICARPKHSSHERLKGGRGVETPTRHHLEFELPMPFLGRRSCVPRQGLCGGDSLDPVADMRQTVLVFSLWAI